MRRRRMALALLTLAAAVSSVAAQQPVVIEGATVVSPHLGAPMTNASVFIRDGRIEAVLPADELDLAPEIQRIDGRGKWVIPGLVEYHTHSRGAAALSRALALGVTSAQIISGSGSPIEVEERSHLADEPSPRIVLLTGRIGQFVGAPTPMSPEAAAAEVRQMRLSGVRAIKVWHDDGLLWFAPDNAFPAVPEPALRALVREAHELGMEVVAHAWRLNFFRMALDAEVDRLIHPVCDATVPDAVWARMREGEMAWTTTMSALLTWADVEEYTRRVMADPRLVASYSGATLANLVDPDFARGRYERFPIMRQNRELYLQTVAENTRNALANRVNVVVGSDATLGVGTHIEIELMAEAGMTPEQILRAATTNGAGALGFGDWLGTVEVGKTADLVILNSDPLEDVRNLRDTFLILKGGHVFEPRELRQVGG